MLEKTKNYLVATTRQLSDVRALGQVVFAIIVLMISWSGIKAIQTNYDLQKQIVQAEQRNDVQRLENENLKLRNEYFTTGQYLELAARQEFGKGRPGERVLIVSKNVALAHTIAPPTPSKKQKIAGQVPFYQQNFEAWMKFFFHKNATAV